MGVGGQRGLPHPGQQFPEARVPAGVGAQHQGVDEAAHRVVERVVGAARDRGADRDVGARAQPAEQGGQRGLDHHEQGRVGVAGEVAESGVGRRAQGERHPAAAVGGHRRTGPVGGERELFGEVRQRPGPVRHLAGERAVRVVPVAEQIALPQGVVGVLDRQRRPGRGPAGAAHRVGGGQVAGERQIGPGVARDVVQDEHQYVVVGAEGQQLGVEREFGGQVEPVARRGGQRPGEPGLVHRAHRQGGDGVGGGEDVLARGAAGLRVDGAQDLVPLGHIREGGAQRGGVQRAAQPQRERHGVCRAGPVELMEEPQPRLGVRQRQRIGAVGGRAQRGPRGTAGGVDAGGESGRGGRLEDVPHRQFRPEDGPDTGDEPGGEQRVPAEREEPVVDPGPPAPQHLGEQLGGVGAQGGGVRDRPGRGDHVRHEPPVPGPVLPYDGHGVGHGLGTGQDRLDLAEFHAEAADLHLVVRPPGELQRAVRGPAAQVPGAVHPGPGRAERVGHEPFRGQARPVEVAAGELGAGQVQLAGDARRHRAQPRVEDVDGHVDDRAADPGPLAVRHHGADGVDRALAGRVVVVGHGGGQGAQLPPQAGAGGLGAEHDRCGLVSVAAEQAEPEEFPGDGGGGAQVADAVPLYVGTERGGVPAGVLVDDVQFVSGEEAEQLPDARVERQRRGVRHPQPSAAGPRRRGEDPLAVGGVEVGDAAVPYHHALGHPGGAGGVDDEGGVVGVDGDARERLVPQGLVVQRLVVQRHQVRRVVAEPPGGRPLGQEHPYPGVGEHERQPLARVSGIQRYAGPARLPDGQDRGDHGGRPGHAQPDQGVRADAALGQPPGQPVHPRAEFRVRQGRPADGHRRCVGGQRRLPLEDFGGGTGGGGAGSAGPFGEDAPPLGGGQYLQRPDARVRGDGRGAQQGDEAGQQLLGGGVVVQVGAVLQEAAEPVRLAGRAARLGEAEGKVELGRADLGHVRVDPQPGQVEPGFAVVVQGQHGLEQRVAGRRPGRVDRLHHVLEGHVLVGVGGQRGLPHSLQQLAEGRVAGGVQAQHQGVEEEADQVVQGIVGAAGDRAAERDVGARAESGEQRGETGLQHHEQAGARGAGHPLQGGVEFGVDRDRHGPAGVPGHRGAGPVGGQGQLLGQPVEGTGPVGGLPGEQAVRVVLVAQQLPLPQRVVGVLDRQRVPVRGGPGPPRRVGGGQVTGQRAVGPAVARDVVDHHHQDVGVRGEGQQPGAQRGFAGQLEPVGRRGGHGLGEPPLPGLRHRAHRQLDRGGGRSGLQDHLMGYAVGVREDRAQALVAGHHVAEGGGERGAVEVALQPDDERQVVVGRGGVQFVQEPQPALGVRQRDRRRAPVAGAQRGAPAAVGAGQPGGETGHRRGLEHGADGQFRAEHRPYPADQAGGEEGVPAEGEEPVVGADPVHAEHFGEEPAQDLLLRAARWTARAGPGAGGCGEGAPVHLAVAGEREHVEGGEHRRDHGLGQSPGQVGAQGVRVGRGTGGRYDVGHQPPVARPVLAYRHRRLGHLGVSGQRGLDLAGFDAEAADLDLVVGAAREAQRAVRGQPGQVPGAVHPLPGRAVRGGHEPLGREAGPVQIAAGQLVPGDVQLAGDAGRHRPQPGVEDVGAYAGHRAADRDGRGVRVLAGGEGEVQASDGGLGGAVVVDHGHRRVACPPGRERSGGQRLAAEHQLPRRGERPGQRGQEGQMARGGLHEGDGGAGQPVGQPRVVVQRRHDHLPAGAQRPVQAGDGQVVGERGGHQDGAVQPGVDAPGAGHVAGQAAVADHHALGGAGGAGGVDDVRGVVGQQWGGPVGVGDADRGLPLQRPYGVRVVQHQAYGAAGLRQRGDRLARGHQQGGGGVVEQPGVPLAGVGEVEGQIGGPGGEHREQGDDEFGGAGQRDGDQALRTGPVGDQQPGQPVGPGSGLGVRPPRVGRGDGGGVRSGGGLPLEQLRQEGGWRLGGRRRGTGGVPLHQDAVALGPAQHLQGRQRPSGVFGGGLQEPDPAGRQSLDGGAVEQVGAVSGVSLDAVRGAVGARVLRQVERQVELGGAGLHPLDDGPQPGQVDPSPESARERQRHLEQRVAAQRPDRVDHLDQVLEGHVLVGVGGEVRLPHPGEEFAEVRVAGGVGAQHQGVDEEAHQVVQGLVGAARDGGADRDVGARAVPGQQRGEPGPHHHEHRHPVALGQRREPPVQRGVDTDRHGAAAVAGHGGAGPVGGQVEFGGEPGQGTGPVRHLARDRAVLVGLRAQQVALPQRVVGIAHRQRGPLRRLAATPRRIRCGQVAGQRHHGPGVGRDVVHHQGQHMPVRAEREQLGAQREFGGQVEAGGGARGERRVQFRRVGAAHRQGDGGGREHDLPRRPVHLRVHRAQRLVAGHHVGERGPQGVPVERAVQPQHERHVVAGPGLAPLQTAQEPQPALGGGERDRLGARGAPQRWPGGAARGAEGRGEARRRRRLEEGAQRHLGAEFGPDPAQQPGGQQGVAAEVEEAVIGPDVTGHAEDVGEQAAQQPLGRVARRAAGGCGGELRGGEGGPVQLAVDGQGQPVQDDDGRRDHMGGQAPRGVGAQLARVGTAGTGGGDGVGHQPPVAGPVLAQRHHGLCDRRVAGQRGLDLAGLDPESAQFHLRVGAARVVEPAVPVAAGQVPGAVHPGAGRAVRVGDEPLGGQPRPPRIAAGEPGPRHVQLAGDTGRHRAQGDVEDVRAQVGNGLADAAARRPGRGVRRGERRVGDMDRGLGDAVHVHQPRRVGRMARVPVPQPAGVQLLAAEYHGAQGESGRALRVLLIGEGQLVKGGRGLVEHGDPLAHQQVQERAGGAADLVFHDDQPAAVQQRPPHLPDGEVEGEGVEQRPHVVRAEAEPLLGRGEQPHHVAVRDEHALGGAGGTRGVDHVRRVGGVQRPVPVGVGQVAAGLGGQGAGGGLRVERQRGAGGVRQVRGQVGRGDHAHRVGVGQCERDALGRIAGVDRQIRGAGLHHRQQGHHEVGGARQRHRHQPLRPGAAPHQQPRQPVGPGVEPGVGERGVPGGDRGGVRGTGGPLLEPAGQYAGRGLGARRGHGRQGTGVLVWRQEVQPPDRRLGAGGGQGVQQVE